MAKNYVICDVCGAKISIRCLKRHKKGQRCGKNLLINKTLSAVKEKMQEKGWVEIGGGHWKLIVNAGIPVEKATSRAEVFIGGLYEYKTLWAPDWAVAIAKHTYIKLETRRKALLLAKRNIEARNRLMSCIALLESGDSREGIVEEFLRTEGFSDSMLE